MSSFVEQKTWIASFRPGYIYQIDYPIFDRENPEVIQYVVCRARLLKPLSELKEGEGITPAEIIDLGRYGDLGSAQAACQKHAEENP